MSYSGLIRRIDLQLRGEYPEITTTIYQLAENDFIIYCKVILDDFQEIFNAFNQSIRPIGIPVKVSCDVPQVYEQIIEPITDNSISKGFEGLYPTAPMLFNLLLSKFPKVRFYKVETAPQGGKVLIFTARYLEVRGTEKTHKFLSTGDRAIVEHFLEELKLPFTFEVIDQVVDEVLDDFPQYEYEPVQFLHAAKLRKNRDFEFAKRDEALWFDNVDKIFEGNFNKKDLYFFNNDSYSCYVDFSSFSNIDLRNHLLLFQVVYLTPPFETNIEKWLNTANIAKKDFLDLIAKGRIKLILTQMESRYDISFILEAYAAKPDGVITRRALATLQQVDIVNISDNYILNDHEFLQELIPACLSISTQSGVDPKFLYEMLTWPIKARRKSFEPLHFKGVFGTPIFGINNAIEKKISETAGQDLSFDFTVNSSSIHLANSLEATYFPFGAEGEYSDHFYASMMGDFLNFYKSATEQNLIFYIENNQKIDNGVIPINPIDIIRVNDFISLGELEKEIINYPTFGGGKLLMETLAPLNEEERFGKIEKYNNEIVKNLNRNKVLPHALDLVTSAALDGAGIATGNPFIGTAFSILKMSGNIIKNAASSEKLTTKLNTVLSQNPDKENIHFLTKINRVARVKRKF